MRLSIGLVPFSSYLTLNNLKSWLAIIETGAIQKLGCGFLFAFYSYYGRICNRLRYLASKSGVTLKTGLGFVQGHWKWHHVIDRIRVPIRLP